jgi:hypothetical protein
MASMFGTRDGAEMLRLDEAAAVQQTSPDSAREAIAWRIALNMRETGHPFHHKTANGTIVDADRTLEALVARLTDAAPAVPVIHDWYQTEAGMAFLKSTYDVH